MADSNVTTIVEPTLTVDPAPVVPAKAAPAADLENPDWLPKRLERERAKILKELGVEKTDDVKAALAAIKAQREAEKTAADKAAEAAQRAAAAEQSAAAMKSILTEHAARQMIGLTAEQKAAVNAIAGEDPALQLKAITALQPTWNAAPAAQPAPVKPASVDTTPPANAPAATTISPTDHRAHYEALRKTNPFAAAVYAQQHQSLIYGDR